MIPVYVLSLRRNKKRRRYIQNHLKELGIPFKWVDAVDGKKLTTSEKETYLSNDRQLFAAGPMSDGAIGCLMSHRLAWQKIFSNSESAALILEDDAALHPDTKATLHHIEMLIGRFDIIHLHHTIKNPLFGKFRISPTHSLSLHKYNGVGNIAYVISQDACRLLIDQSLPAVFEIDLLCQRWWVHGVTTLTINPALAREVGCESTIGYSSTPEKWQKDTIWNILNRYFNRRKDSILKRYLFRRMFSSVMSRLERDLNN